MWEIVRAQRTGMRATALSCAKRPAHADHTFLAPHAAAAAMEGSYHSDWAANMMPQLGLGVPKTDLIAQLQQRMEHDDSFMSRHHLRGTPRVVAKVHNMKSLVRYTAPTTSRASLAVLPVPCSRASPACRCGR